MSSNPPAVKTPNVPRPQYSLADPYRVRVTTDPTGEAKTKQAFKEEADINNIVDKYHRTGIIEHQKTHGGSYGEFSEFDYHTAIEQAREAERVFSELPSAIRDSFNYDPAAFFAWVTTANADELREAGFLPPQAAPVPDDAEPTDGAPS